MKNILNIYNDFYRSGNLEELIKSLDKIGQDTSRFKGVKMMPKKVISAVNCIVAYLENFGLDLKVNNGQYLTDLISKEKSEMRFIVTEQIYNTIVNTILDGNFPEVKFGQHMTQFNEVFMLEINENDISFEELVRKSVMVYLIGLPMSSFDTYEKLKRAYFDVNGVMQAIGYVAIKEEWFNNMLLDLASFGLSLSRWCVWFDGSWIDVSNQFNSGFITIPKIEDGKLMFVVCTSTLYIGEYFLTSYRIFNILYNNRFLETIRFVDKEVSVADDNGRVSNKIVSIPVYTENSDEHFVSEIAGSDFVYFEQALRDVGCGY